MKMLNKFILGLIFTSILSIPNLYAATAKEAFDSGDLEQAKTLFKQAPKSAEANFYLGRIAFLENDLDAAEDYFEDAVEADPKNVEYNYWFANLNFSQAANASIFSAPGYVSDAKEYHFKALKLDPNYIPSMQSLITFYLNAPAIVGGSTDKAKEMAQRISKLDKERGMSIEIDILRNQEEQQKELQLAKQLAADFSQSAKSLLKAGFSFQNAKQYKTAINYFEQASKIETEDEVFSVSALYQIGRTAVFSKSFIEKGISALEKYRQVDIKSLNNNQLPSSNWANLRLAMLYSFSGDNNKAKSLVALALKDNQDKNLKKAAKKLLKEL